MGSSDDTPAVVIRDAVLRAAREGTADALWDALRCVPAAAIADFFHASFATGGERTLLTRALGASPGAASGEIVVSAEDAVAAADAGRAVILVRNETTPDDVLGMQSARGIVTTRGGTTSHAAVVARGWGIPAVVGASEIVLEPQGLRIGDRLVAPGTRVSIDGRTGEVFLGGTEVRTAEAPEELTRLLDWADRVRAACTPPVAVRANADTSADATHARHLGAEGIGLCRTEHMFLAEDRLPLVRRLILADGPGTETDALADLEAAQQRDFEGILAAMDGLPVTVRLLDPPLHEFLPDFETLLVDEALGKLDDRGLVELAAVRRLREVNPMIGTRGVRLGVVRPGVYQMQVRALFRAVAAAEAAGLHPTVEVMIPLVVAASEMRLAREWVAEALDEIGYAGHHHVGAMLETPRAALLSGELATVSDFFSFGTNDLTQLVFAFSRDDVGSRLIPEYLRTGLLDRDPFECLDKDGVGLLIERACRDARNARPGIAIGVCGEQAGDPESAAFLVAAGVDYVSCSPYRVPIARLAVAQAVVGTARLDHAALDAIAAGIRDETTPVEPPAQEHPAPGPGAPGTPAEYEFTVLHALRIKGFATAEVVAQIAETTEQSVLDVLPGFVEAGWCRHIAARDLWQLTPAGRERHAALLAAVPGEELHGLRPPYEEFLALNTGFKELCTRWQTRGEDANDHTDAAYDAARVAELRDLHREAVPVLERFAAAVRRFAAYEHRLAGALHRTEEGETRMFTGVMCGSYHDVWMELHEDLVQLLGVDRHAEGSY